MKKLFHSMAVNMLHVSLCSLIHATFLCLIKLKAFWSYGFIFMCTPQKLKTCSLLYFFFLLFFLFFFGGSGGLLFCIFSTLPPLLSIPHLSVTPPLLLPFAGLCRVVEGSTLTHTGTARGCSRLRDSSQGLWRIQRADFTQ